MSQEPAQASDDHSALLGRRQQSDGRPGRTLHKKLLAPRLQDERWRLVGSGRSSVAPIGRIQRPLFRASGSAPLLVGAALLISIGCNRADPASEAAADQARIDAMFEGIGGREAPDTPESLRRKQEQIEEKLEKAEEATQAEDLDQAIQLLGESLYLDSKHRTAKLRMIETLHQRSLALEPTDVEQAGMDIRLAGVYLSHLRNENQVFSEDELRLFAQVYFDEARVYGRTQHRATEFMEAFGNAMEMGFADLERLKTEPDFAQFRANPRTAKLIDDAVASLEGPNDETPKGNADPAETSP